MMLVAYKDRRAPKKRCTANFSERLYTRLEVRMQPQPERFEPGFQGTSLVLQH
jgi:hypothetical protein